jgi:hypothetical protein
MGVHLGVRPTLGQDASHTRYLNRVDLQRHVWRWNILAVQAIIAVKSNTWSAWRQMRGNQAALARVSSFDRYKVFVDLGRRMNDAGGRRNGSPDRFWKAMASDDDNIDPNSNDCLNGSGSIDGRQWLPQWWLRDLFVGPRAEFVFVRIHV